ncbi:MAG: helix-hairpin-helix domain-containing protein [Thermodesulfovibrionales bacterium]
MQRTNRKSTTLGWLLMFVVAVVSLSLSMPGAFAKEAKGLVDINTASQKDLEVIKGIGPATAKKIIENRPYKSVDELSKAGISAKKIDALKPFVSVGPAAAAPQPPKAATKPAQAPAAAATPAVPAAPAPAKVAPAPKSPSAVEKQATSKLAPGEKVNINTASKEKLEALPGIGPVKAQAIIDGRPFSSPEDIMKVKGIKEGGFSKIKDIITVK